MRPRFSVTQDIEPESMNSQEERISPSNRLLERKVLSTLPQSGKERRARLVAAGRAGQATATRVTTPSVPSDPISRC